MNFHFADNYIKVMHLLPDRRTWLETVHSADRGAKHGVSSLAPIFPQGTETHFFLIIFKQGSHPKRTTRLCVCVGGFFLFF